MPETKKQIQPILRSAQFIPGTFNEEGFTIEAIAATEAEVISYSWDYGQVREVLSMQTDHVRLQRLVGANVLNNHNRYGSVQDCVVGVIEEANIRNSQLVVKIRLSQREDLKPLVEDVKNGIIRNLSVGYRIYTAQVTEEIGKLPMYRAIDWEPFEVSFVAVPADANATVRSENKLQANEVTIINSKNRNMPEVINTPEAGDQTRSQAPAAAPAAPSTTETVDVDKERKAAAKASQNRSVEILSAVRSAGFDVAYAEELIGNEQVTVDGARKLILEKMAANSSTAQTRSANVAIVGDDEQVKERKALEFALGNRMNAAAFQIGNDKDAASTLAANYRGISAQDVAKQLLKQRGIILSGYSKQEVYERSMSTSDFPNLMSNLTGKVLRKEYEATAQTFKAIAEQQNLPDFKEASGIQFGGVADFDEVKEGAEFKYGKTVETKDGWKLSTYGKLFKFTRQMFINDDLAGLNRLARLIAIGAANNESNVFWALITGNVKLLDNKALFHSDHNNIGTSGVLSATTMAEARTKMRRQTGLTTDELINVTPKYIVIAPEQEMAADQLLTNITPNASGSVNPFTSAGLQKIVEPRLASPVWYVFADPSMLGSFTYGYLEGNEGLYTETRHGFEVDGIEFKARQDFAAKAWDYRGSFKNAGV
jgi:hypothetical protein